MCVVARGSVVVPFVVVVVGHIGTVVVVVIDDAVHIVATFGAVTVNVVPCDVTVPAVVNIVVIALIVAHFVDTVVDSTLAITRCRRQCW